MKINSVGDIVWKSIFGGSKNEIGYSITTTNDGGYVLTGYTFSNHTNISNQSSAILGAIQGQGFLQMPQVGPALPDSTIQFIKCWVSQGKLNN